TNQFEILQSEEVDHVDENQKEVQQSKGLVTTHRPVVSKEGEDHTTIVLWRPDEIKATEKVQENSGVNEDVDLVSNNGVERRRPIYDPQMEEDELRVEDHRHV
ncbi:hypothetical protein HAX54_052843, partial [Datura stramonium]|nr:hypothetical protein [Datura stramonium]